MPNDPPPLKLRRAKQRSKRHEVNDNENMKEKIKNIAKVMSEKYSLDISMYDDSFLEQTVTGRMAETSSESIDDYLHYVEIHQAESLSLIDSLNNSYSEFFRNPLTFLILEQLVLPQIFREKELRHAGEIRIWSAGCAAGQEPYSLAILANDFKNNSHESVNLRIFATGKSEKELHTARKGIYHVKAIQNSRLGIINKYFSNSGEFYSISSNIRDLIDFSLLDLLEDSGGAPPASIYGDFDIIMCSNLLFYYKSEIQKKILTRLYNSLVNGGFLITGEAEVGIVKNFRKFKQYAAPAALFIKT